VVYGILAGLLAMVVAVLVLLGAIRGIDSIVGIFMDPPRIWVTYLVLGVLFTVAGSLIFRRRRRDEA
jgi:LPXTG-motif cell wall-anchored protein